MKIWLVALGLSGCFSAAEPATTGGFVTMTPQIVQNAGTRAFRGPYEQVFAAVEGALTSEGFPIAISNRAGGLIKTGQKLIRADAVTNYYRVGTTTTAEITRQYVVRVHATGELTTVSAEPRVFEGDAELTDQAIWVLEGPKGERSLWQRLFRDIQEAL